MIVTYFQREPKRMEVLELMSRILSFTEEEKAIVGLTSSKSGWLNPLKGFFSTNQSPVKFNHDKLKEASLTELWVEFLLKEASDSIEDTSQTNNTTNLTTTNSQLSPNIDNKEIKSPVAANHIKLQTEVTINQTSVKNPPMESRIEPVESFTGPTTEKNTEPNTTSENKG